MENVYIVNYQNEEGFAVFTTDERLPQVIGYSDNGNITDTLNCPGTEYDNPNDYNTQTDYGFGRLDLLMNIRPTYQSK